MTTSVFHVDDMHCSACESRIHRALDKLPGIRGIKINPIRRELFVDHDNDIIPMLEVFGHIENTGFSPVVEQHGTTMRNRDALKRLGIAGIAMMQVMMQALALYAGDYQGMRPEFVRLFEFTSLLFCIPVVFYSAQPFFRGALRSVRALKRWRDVLVGLSMEVPVALAIAVAFAASVVATLTGSGAVYYDSVVMFTFLLLLARFIDQRLSARLVAGDYSSLLPAQVLKLTDAGEQRVTVHSLVRGDLVRVLPGQRVPADGRVTTGTALLDESLLTGEVDAVTRHVGQEVAGGTLNYNQAFTLQVTRPPAESRVAQIEAVSRQAELDKPAFVQRADLIAGVFVGAMLLIAGLTFAVWMMLDSSRALSVTLAVLVVSCPCALALATPAAATAALTFLRSRGIIVTRGAVLEAAADIGALALDKTGTLTTGALCVGRTEVFAGNDDDQVMALAAGLERDSQHPVARAFVHAKAVGFNDTQIHVHGVEGLLGGQEYRLGTAEFCGINAGQAEELDDRRIVWLTRAGELLAKFYLEEKYRRDTETTLRGIRSTGITTKLLSGDSAGNCQVFSPFMEIDAQLDPDDKLRALKNLREEHGAVMMIGDGVNDIPVLANADIAAVVMEAPDLVKSKADVIFLTNRLRPVLDFLLIAKRVRRVIKQNLFWAVAYNITMIPLAATGVLAPWAAALGMSLSSLLVTLNAGRLNRRGR